MKTRENAGEVVNLLPRDGAVDYYGDEGMAWHSDDEKELEPGGAIASLSFGAERRFLLRHRENKETIEVLLAAGSLLVMRGSTQTHWLHSLPKMKKVRLPRVNLTFRSMVIAGERPGNHTPAG